MTLVEKEIRSSLSNFFSCTPDQLSLIELGGYNNTNYKLSVFAQDYFVKFANRQEELFGSSIQNEVACMTGVYSEGIAPKVVYYDPEKFILVSEFIEGQFNFDTPRSKERYVHLLHRLHGLNLQFSKTFCPINTIKEYENHARTRKAKLPKILLDEILPKIYSFQKEKLFIKKVPCHVDPQFANVLDQGEKLYFVDWEFAAMSEPLFDLASMCASEELSDNEMDEMLTLYLVRSPTVKEQERFRKIRIIADLRMCLFCYLYTTLPVANADEYEKFAESFLNQAIGRLDTV